MDQQKLHDQGTENVMAQDRAAYALIAKKKVPLLREHGMVNAPKAMRPGTVMAIMLVRTAMDVLEAMSVAMTTAQQGITLLSVTGLERLEAERLQKGLNKARRSCNHEPDMGLGMATDLHTGKLLIGTSTTAKQGTAKEMDTERQETNTPGDKVLMTEIVGP